MEKSKASGLTRVNGGPILLTGATGYTGSRLLRELEAAGCTMPCLARHAHRHRVVRTTFGSVRPGVALRRAAAVALVAAMTLPLAGAAAHTPPPVRTVPFVDLDRYAGDWFEIARFRNRFQRQCVGDVRATYGRRPDGRVDVVNRCRTAEGETEAPGVARIVDERTFAKLKVRFARGRGGNRSTTSS